MEQGSSTWLEWRRRGIGASDCAAVLGASPWMTAHTLWRDKMGLRSEDENDFNEAIRFGQMFEESARAQASVRLDMDFKPALAEHKDYPFIRASLDGLDEDKNHFIEIKYVGKEKFEQAVFGKIPEHYRIQMDQQFLVTGCPKAHYVCFMLSRDKKKIENIHLLPVEPRIDFIKGTLLPALQNFWKLVETKTPPPLSPKDEKTIDEPFFLAVAEKFKRLTLEIKERETELELIKKTLSETVLKSNLVRCGELKIQRIFRRGSVEYGKIPELKGVDLEPYRKGDIEYLNYRLEKGSQDEKEGS